MPSPRKRHSSGANLSHSSHNKKHRNSTFDGTMSASSVNHCSWISTDKGVGVTEHISPESLAFKLAEKGEDLAKKNAENVDLIGLNITKGAQETAEEFLRRREEVKHLLGNPKSFDDNSHVDLNYGVAAVGGAKLLVDQTRTTRSVTQKLVSCCGLNKEEFLYNGLKRDHLESKAIEEINKNRESSVVESFVDFQKQIHFKMTVLDHLADRIATRTPKSYPRAANTRIKGNPFKTPVHKGSINPLDNERIVDSYALEVASKVVDRSKRRRISGIPFNIHLLDNEEE